MSTIPIPYDSLLGTPIQPKYNPAQTAKVPMNHAPGMGAKALLARTIVKSHNRTYISPTDSMMTPVTQKLNAAKKKYFNKPQNGVSLFSPCKTNESSAPGDEDDGQPKPSVTTTAPAATPITMQHDEENPF